MDLGTASQVGFFGNGGRSCAEVPVAAAQEGGSVKFPLGHIVATPGALEAFRASGNDPLAYLARHLAGDWGDVDEHDRKDEHVSFLGDLHRQIANTPDGAKVRLQGRSASSRALVGEKSPFHLLTGLGWV